MNRDMIPVYFFQGWYIFLRLHVLPSLVATLPYLVSGMFAIKADPHLMRLLVNQRICLTVYWVTCLNQILGSHQHLRIGGTLL